MSRERINRGLQQRLYLINVKKNCEDDWKFDVEGSTGNIYEVRIKENITCECIDFHKRNKICKHIYFIIGKVFDKKNWLNTIINDNPDINLFEVYSENNSENNFNNFINDKFYKKKEPEPEPEKNPEKEVNKDYLCDELCGICYDNFTKEDLLDKIENCIVCKNYLHKSCLKVWLPRSSTCPYCRSNWGGIELKKEHNGLEKLMI